MAEMEIDRNEGRTVSDDGKGAAREKTFHGDIHGSTQGRKTKVLFCLICLIFIFLAGVAGGALCRYLYEVSLLEGMEEDCPFCRLKAEGKLQVKNGSGLGVLQLHTGQFLVLGRKKGEENGVSVLLMYAGKYGSTVETESGGRVSEIDIFLSEESVWDREITKDILCGDCMKELSELQQTSDDGVIYDVALVDLESGELLQVKEGSRICFTKDFVLHFDHYDDRIGIIAVYAPDR